MLKIAALIWVMLGTVLAGSAVVAVLMTGNGSGELMKLIPFAAIGGYAIALPLSWLVAKRLGQPRMA